MGAWIETAVAGVVSGVKSVAPYVGAWIETDPNKGIKTQYKSHPTWVRGLKLDLVKQTTKESFVAPYVGAWIETFQ